MSAVATETSWVGLTSMKSIRLGGTSTISAPARVRARTRSSSNSPVTESNGAFAWAMVT